MGAVTAPASNIVNKVGDEVNKTKNSVQSAYERSGFKKYSPSRFVENNLVNPMIREVRKQNKKLMVDPVGKAITGAVDREVDFENPENTGMKVGGDYVNALYQKPIGEANNAFNPTEESANPDDLANRTRQQLLNDPNLSSDTKKKLQEAMGVSGAEFDRVYGLFAPGTANEKANKFTDARRKNARKGLANQTGAYSAAQRTELTSNTRSFGGGGQVGSRLTLLGK